MSRLFFGLLLAGAAAPALAAGGPHGRHNDDDNSSPRQESRAERPARGGGEQARPQSNRSERAERPANVERPQFAGRPQFNGQRPQFNGERPQFNGQRPQFNGERPQFNGERPQVRGDTQPARPVMRENPYAQSSDSVRNWRPREQNVRSGGSYQQRQTVVDYDRDTQHRFANRDRREPIVSNVPRQGTQPPARFDRRREGGIHWNTNWRNDHRYDWRDRRRHHRSLFHIGFYIDPFGWDYQPYSSGWRLWPNYYQQNYWIDPAMYGLPYPPPGMQWVRYYNDALLVDTFTGQVVDSIQGFFW